MERYGTDDVPDPFARSMALGTRDRGIGPRRGGRLIESESREIVRRFFQDHLALRALREEDTT